MALESSTYINGLVVTNPTGSDNISQGDDHIRLLKSTIKATFPNVTGAVSGTHTEINSAVTKANLATNSNTANTIVKRNASGNFSAGTITAALNGNATTATTLQTARTIGGVNFNGSANINLPGVNTSGDQDTSGNAATATQLATARTIGGVSFDGTANINLPGVNTAGNQSTSGNAATATTATTATNVTATANNSANENIFITLVDAATGSQGIETDTGLKYNPSTNKITTGALTLSGALVAASLDISGNVDVDGTLEADAITVASKALNEFIEDTVGAMFAGNTETNITATYQDGDGTIDLAVATETIQDLIGSMVTGNTETGITVTYDDSANEFDFSVSTEHIQDIVGAMVAANTESGGISVTYQDGDGTLDFAVSGVNAASVDGKSIAVVSSMPGSPDANTIYFVT